jgi:hypothetical protein
LLATIEKIEPGPEAEFAHYEMLVLQAGKTRRQIIAMDEHMRTFTECICLGVIDIVVIDRMRQAVGIPEEVGVGESGVQGGLIQGI